MDTIRATTVFIMSSASDRRYQSRLFNFIHHQARRVSEQCSQGFRHLRVATSWGTQVLLYPIYLLFQSTELAGKMHSSVQESWPELSANDNYSQPQTPPTADTPIQRVLLLAQTVATPAETQRFKKTEESVSSRKRPVVRGIATQLSNRILVLVTAQNEILDILTPQQQKKLQQRIMGEVANYWRHLLRRGRGALEQSAPLPLLDQGLVFVDRTVAKLESSHLAPVSEVAIALAQSSWGLALAAKTRLTVSLSGKAQPDDTQKPAIAPDPAASHKYRIQALIWAAIDYFFSHPRSASKLPSRHQLVSDDVDPWLTLGDLFGTPELGGELPARQKTIKSKAVGTQIAPAPEWIETHATASGYVKHPLEQLLGWLDRIMLALEELLVRIFQWVQQMWIGK